MLSVKNVKHTVNGAIGERKSPRVYTHAVVARMEYEQRLAHRVREALYLLENTVAFYLDEAQKKAGDPRFDRLGRKYDNVTVLQSDIDRAKRWLDVHGRTVEQAAAVIEAQVRKEQADFRASHSDNFYVLSWSMSLANAQKAAASTAKNGFYRDVQVRDVTRHVKGL